MRFSSSSANDALPNPNAILRVCTHAKFGGKSYIVCTLLMHFTFTTAVYTPQWM